MGNNIAIEYFNGPGFWVYGIKARELLISKYSDVNSTDTIVKSIAKTAFNAAVRISSAPFPILPEAFKYIAFPYSSSIGVITNTGLALVKGTLAVANKDWNQGKEALSHVAFAALEYFGMSYLDVGTIACGLATIYAASGVVTDLTKVSEKIHSWMFPAPEQRVKTVEKIVYKDREVSRREDQKVPEPPKEVKKPSRGKGIRNKEVQDILRAADEFVQSFQKKNNKIEIDN